MKPVCSDKQARGAATAERSGHMTGNQIGEKIQSHIWFHCFGKIKQLLEEMDPPVLALWRTFTQLKIWPQVYLSLTWDGSVAGQQFSKEIWDCIGKVTSRK